jgi:hypothetical protein
MEILCVISWFLWGVVFVLVSPEDIGLLGVMLFLTALGSAFFCSFFLLFYYIRISLLARTPIFREFHSIFRESILLAFFFIISLLLFHSGRTGRLNFILLFFLFILVDIFYFIVYDKRDHKKAGNN